MQLPEIISAISIPKPIDKVREILIKNLKLFENINTLENLKFFLSIAPDYIKEQLVEADLNETFEYGGDNCTFDHNVNDPYGWEGNQCYRMTFQQQVNPWAETKKIQKRKGKYYIMTESGKEVRLLTIHYQGGAKEGLANNVHGFE